MVERAHERVVGRQPRKYVARHHDRAVTHEQDDGGVSEREGACGTRKRVPSSDKFSGVWRLQIGDGLTHRNSRIEVGPGGPRPIQTSSEPATVKKRGPLAQSYHKRTQCRGLRISMRRPNPIRGGGGAGYNPNRSRPPDWSFLFSLFVLGPSDLVNKKPIKKIQRPGSGSEIRATGGGGRLVRYHHNVEVTRRP